MGRNNRYRPRSGSINKGKDTEITEDLGVVKLFVYSNPVTVGELAKSLHIPTAKIMQFLLLEGKMLSINSLLDDELIGAICLNFDCDFRKEEIVAKEDFEEEVIEDSPECLSERAPIVTIMGHVDHGKTTLIDAIRDSHVALSEAGSITQAIGAYQKVIQGKKITFLDTPGHEAFTAMRARGAQITDVAIIVVAADDGIMPQTKEAIDHARAAGVTIIVAINKIDKPGANIEKVKNELSDLNLIPEDWGGDIICKEISAKKNIGIDELLETVLVIAELKELKANASREALGVVIEASLDKNEGPKATLLVQNGTLHVGDYLVVGSAFCKVRRMTNEQKRNVKLASPSTPVVITGLDIVPSAGDHFKAFSTEKEAKGIADLRKTKKKDEEMRGNNAVTLEDLYDKFKTGELKTINIIIKADTTGSAEAVCGSLEKLQNAEVNVNILRATAGAITESDILLASASKAIIYGFNVRPDANIRSKALEAKVDIRLHTIIYALKEEIEAAMKGMLKPVFKEVVYGQAEVRTIFKASKIGTVAGCMVTSGLLKRDGLVRIMRDNGIVIFEGSILGLKRFKDDVKEVKEGFDCGVTIKDYSDFHENDIFECYGMEEVKK